FFIAVGMSIDFAVVFAQPGRVALIVLGFLAVKAVVMVAIARFMPIPRVERPTFVILLAQGGEFGFVVFQAAAGAGVVDAATASRLVAAVAISMLLTPLLLLLRRRRRRRQRQRRQQRLRRRATNLPRAMLRRTTRTIRRTRTRRTSSRSSWWTRTGIPCLAKRTRSRCRTALPSPTARSMRTATRR
ncbi:MAG TPA: hypothetical protein DEH78_00065, partial [Solibacterales bacterium]|nr:hypothetical protein [Bryobacterales bacterium]